MEAITNHLGQPIGFAVPDWVPARLPPRTPLEGRWCRVAPLDVARHGTALFAAYGEDREGCNWTYMGYGPFETLAEFEEWMAASCLGDDPLFHAVVEAASGRALGLASYLRAQPEAGVIEVGNIHYAPPLQRTAAATEAMFLMMARVFDELGYRRYEWKYDALNAASRRGAERLGFVFEGVFRQATLYKGRNRDTAWYAITDRDWPALKRAYETWLDPANFDATGAQKTRLSELVAGTRA